MKVVTWLKKPSIEPNIYETSFLSGVINSSKVVRFEVILKPQPHGASLCVTLPSTFQFLFCFYHFSFLKFSSVPKRY